MPKPEYLGSGWADPASAPGLPVIVVNVAPSETGVNIYVSMRVQGIPQASPQL